MWPFGYWTRSRQHPSGLHYLRSVYPQVAPFCKQEKVRRCQVRTVHNNSHSYLCTNHVIRPGVQLHEATFQHHTEHQKPMIGCNKTGAWTVCANIPGGPLGAFQEEQAMSRHRVSPSLFLSSSSHTTQLHYTNSYTYSHPNLNFLQLVPHVMWSAQAVCELKIDHIQCHLSALCRTRST